MKNTPYVESKAGIKNSADTFGLFILCFFLIAIVRIPLYVFLYGMKFPFHPSVSAQWISGLLSCTLWWSLVYYRPIARLLGRK
jgi:hypothetical protein